MSASNPDIVLLVRTLGWWDWWLDSCMGSRPAECWYRRGWVVGQLAVTSIHAQATTLQNVENSPHFRPERIFKCFNQKSVCIMYKRSLVELLKGMIKSKRFSKLR
jgi:hypothetical protein